VDRHRGDRRRAGGHPWLGEAHNPARLGALLTIAVGITWLAAVTPAD